MQQQGKWVSRLGMYAVLCITLLGGCAAISPAHGPEPTRLVYQTVGQQSGPQAGQDASQQIMWVTSDYLRIDEAGDESGFVLYSREADEIYSVSHDERSIMVIGRSGMEPLPPQSLSITIHLVPDAQAPSVAGRHPQHYQMRASGEVCEEAVVVPGLLPEAVGVWRDYAAQLASGQAQRSESLPAEMVDGCDLARHAYAAAWYLDYGLPIRISDRSGREQLLVDYTHPYVLEDGAMRLPPGYSRYRLPPSR